MNVSVIKGRQTAGVSELHVIDIGSPGARDNRLRRVCVLVSCKRHRFNRVPGPHRGDSQGVPVYPFGVTDGVCDIQR